MQIFKHILKHRLKHTLTTASRCPRPTFDTGCTFCNAPAEILDTVKSTPTDISNTVPLVDRILVYNSARDDPSKWPSRVESIYPDMLALKQAARKASTATGTTNLVIMSSIQGNDVFVWPHARRQKVDITSKESMADLFNDDDTNINSVHVDKPVILICAHGTRDVRCGTIGALVHAEFAKVLDKTGVDAHLGTVTHIGGHIYAGNVIILKPDGNVVWYGMVRPHHVQGIVQLTVLGDTVIKELCRN